MTGVAVAGLWWLPSNMNESNRYFHKKIPNRDVNELGISNPRLVS